ncbi:MAG: hypothetical protein LBI86_09740 [Treponema sp.]|nr:hypothetical protein [Treponema sp.]
MSGTGIAVLSLAAFVIGAVSGGVLVFSLSRSRKESSGGDARFLAQEDHLDETDPHTLVVQSPRPDDLRGRESFLAESARKRIRDRARRVLSGGNGTEPDGGDGG